MWHFGICQSRYLALLQQYAEPLISSKACNHDGLFACNVGKSYWDVVELLRTTPCLDVTLGSGTRKTVEME